MINKNKFKIYIDLDGVLADFHSQFTTLSGLTPEKYKNKYGLSKFWDFIDEENKVKFWVDIPLMDDAKKLINYVKEYDYEILSAPSMKPQSRLGKILWLKKHTPNLFKSIPKINFKYSKEKHLIKPKLSKFDILIDDREEVINNWNIAGGKGIHYQSLNDVIINLKIIGI